MDLSFITVNYRDARSWWIGLFCPSSDFPLPCPGKLLLSQCKRRRIRRIYPVEASRCKNNRASKNIGFGGGNNRGAETASGRVLVPINSDCEISEESFAKPLKYLDENPDIGIVGLKVFTPTGDLEQSARGFPDPSTGLFGRSTFLGKLSQKGKLGKTGAAEKICWSIRRRRAVRCRLGCGNDYVDSSGLLGCGQGIRQGIFMYWEDADLCYRAKQEGFRTVYFPGANVTHKPGLEHVEGSAPAIRYFHDSAYRYVVKHLSPGWSIMRAFAWTALHARASILIAKARKKATRQTQSAAIFAAGGVPSWLMSGPVPIILIVIIGLVLIGFYVNSYLKRIQKNLHELGKGFYEREIELQGQFKAGLISESEYRKRHDGMVREMREESRRMTDGPTR